MTCPGSWRSLVDGALAEEALLAARAIGDELAARAPCEEDEPLSWQYAQAALVHAHLARASNEAPYAATADRFLDLARDALSEESDVAMTLYRGLCGVAFCAVDAARGRDVSVGLEEVDAALDAYVGAERWRGSYDLVSGLVGLGVYALERLPGSRGTISAVLRHLDAAAEHTGEETRWATPHVDGGGVRYDVGMAHGVPGVIALVARCLAAGIDPPRSERLLRGALRWLSRQRLSGSAASAYPYFAGDDPAPTKPAWCYGDPGIAAALLAAARALSSPSLEDEAIALARRGASRAPDPGLVLDAGLCHGALGLAHLSNRMHQATGDESLGVAARTWLSRGLDMRRSGTGIAGFSFYYAPDGATTRWVDDSTFLSGAAGVALALLAFASDAEPTWDRLLLLSGAV